jgi:hypothetical protein
MQSPPCSAVDSELFQRLGQLPKDRQYTKPTVQTYPKARLTQMFPVLPRQKFLISIASRSLNLLSSCADLPD